MQEYSRGAVIADVPSTRAMGIAGKKLEGKYYPEVPVQKMPIPKNVLDYAKRKDVFIRDITGRAYE